MKQTFTLIMVTLFCFMGSATLIAQSQEQKALTIVLTDGTYVQFPLLDVPVAKMDGSNIVFKSTKTEAIYLRTSVTKYYFNIVEVPNSVRGLTNKSETTITTTRDYILLSNPNKLPLPIQVFSLTGSLMNSAVNVISNNSAQIFISGLIPGIYIIKMNNESFKFLKK